MIKLFNNVLDENKKIIYGISNLYGINKAEALIICNQLNISPKLKLKQLNQRVIYNISNYINNNLDIDKELK
jgi:ribosomal protein S13